MITKQETELERISTVVNWGLNYGGVDYVIVETYLDNIDYADIEIFNDEGEVIDDELRTIIIDIFEALK